MTDASFGIDANPSIGAARQGSARGAAVRCR
eukprot:CAMPEP_0197898072 /NCGR_PEP_ID=MMETSP1439-20131203/43140_1 /TAXON_ID=66791 /ORGANISM="Gonyaulax spinifera, Strain CCMP409" /LENGTH=30 /DNA_ID= /DNA_START= /DNA_END= /DNA_ORIENTATION=